VVKYLNYLENAGAFELGRLDNVAERGGSVAAAADLLVAVQSQKR
jgi:hypothetical protein